MSWLRRPFPSSTTTKSYTGTGGVIVAGTFVALSIVYSYVPITKDVIVAGSATVSKTKAPSVVTSDIKVAGSATVAKVKAPTVIRQDIIVAGAGTYVFQQAAFRYTGTGGVIVDSGATWSKVKTYSALTQDVKVNSGATWTKTKVGSVVTQDVIVSGSATVAKVKTYVGSGGVIVDSQGTYSHSTQRTYSGTGGVVVDSGATWSKTKAPATATRDIIVSGTATVAKVKAYAAKTQDIIAAGSATLAVVKVGPVTTQDVIVSGQGTYVLLRGYVGTGGVKVGGSYWLFGQVVKVCHPQIQTPGLDAIAFAAPGLSSIVLTITDQTGEVFDGGSFSAITFEPAGFDSLTFYGDEACPPSTTPPPPPSATVAHLLLEDGSDLLLEDGGLIELEDA